MPVVYTAVKRFDPGLRRDVAGVRRWSGLKQLREVVSLDLMLCPTVFGELTDRGWLHNVQEDFKLTLFHDLDHVLRRVAGDEQVNVFALMENPTKDEFTFSTTPASPSEALTSWSCRPASAPCQLRRVRQGVRPDRTLGLRPAGRPCEGAEPFGTGCGPSTPTSLMRTATCGPSGR